MAKIIKSIINRSGPSGTGGGPHTHGAGDITSGTLVDARVPSLNTSKITAGTMVPARLGSGTADNTKVLYGDSTWKVAPGGGTGGTTDHTALTNIGTNTHPTIDTHLASTANPHTVTKSQVGLGSVNNTSDASKPISTAQQTALDAKYDAVVVDGLVNAEATSRIAEVDNRGIDVTLGPFFINDIPANVSTPASLAYFNTATALSQDSTGIRIWRAGRLVGIVISTDADITAGTAVARIRISGTTYSAMSSTLSTSNPRSNSTFSVSAGTSFTTGSSLGANIVTSADFAPITANAQIYLILRLDDF